MKVNGDAIYGTSASAFKSLPWGRCTTKSNGTTTSLYLHVFDWPSGGKLMVPGIGNSVVSATLLAGKKSLATHMTEGGVTIDVPASAPDANSSVIELKVKGAPVIYEAPEIVAESAKFVSCVYWRVAGRDAWARSTPTYSTAAARIMTPNAAAIASRCCFRRLPA